MARLSTTLLPEIRAILEHNGIDVSRTTSVDLRHSVDGAVTEIAVTILALDPAETDREALRDLLREDRV